MSSTRGIFISTFCMAVDGETKKDPALGWPGDLKANGSIKNLSDFANVLVRNHYFEPDSLREFSGPGYKVYKGKLTSGSNGVLDPPFTDEYCAFKIYLVKKDDPSNTIFLASKNYTYNTPLNPSAKPFGDKGFVACRKAGDTGFYKKERVQDLKLIGKLPGGGTVESAENCLNPGPVAP